MRLTFYKSTFLFMLTNFDIMSASPTYFKRPTISMSFLFCVSSIKLSCFSYKIALYGAVNLTSSYHDQLFIRNIFCRSLNFGINQK